jgi:hypothetical protein
MLLPIVSWWFAPTAWTCSPRSSPLIDPDRLGPIVPDIERLAVADDLVLVVLDQDRPILLPLEVDLLAPLLVLETQLVESFSPRELSVFVVLFVFSPGSCMAASGPRCTRSR